MISEQLGLRVATTSAKSTPRHLRPRRRCEVGFLIIEPAIKCGTPERTRPYPLDVAGRSRPWGRQPAAADLNNLELAYRQHPAISVSSSGIRSKISRCQTRTGRDHPLLGWPTSPPGHLFA